MGSYLKEKLRDSFSFYGEEIAATVRGWPRGTSVIGYLLQYYL
jgi:hypothetical protein